MLPNPLASLLTRTKGFLRKSPADKVRAINATTRHLLHPVGSSNEQRQRLLVDTAAIRRTLHTLAVIELERSVKGLLSDPIYDDKRRLLPYGFKVYSQTDEDGILQEIFARIGETSRIFVEFGVDNGLENNTLKLLLEGWSGLWLEGSELKIEQINKKFKDVIQEGRLRVRHAFIDRENVNDWIGRFYAQEIDLISIDVDGNDIYLLEALTVVNPRVIVIEYNAKFPPPLSIAQAYNATHRWRGTDYTGASLAAITKVAERKGYALVGCNIAGANAFFVRNDLLGDKFFPSHTPQDHYQPPRYHLGSNFVAGHEPDWGPYNTI